MSDVRHSKRPLVLLFTLAVLVVGHFATRDASVAWTRAIPILLVMILGELVREWTLARLSPATTVDARKRRRRHLWASVLAGLALLALSIGAAATHRVPTGSVWLYTFFIAGILGLAVAAAFSSAIARDTVAAKLAEARRTGTVHDADVPGPMTLFFVVIASVGLFAAVNAPVFEQLMSRDALSLSLILRLAVTALVIVAFAVFVWRALLHGHEQLLEAAASGEEPQP